MHLIFFLSIIFSDKKGDSYEELREVCQLLTLKLANAILLRESLKDKKQKLDEHGNKILEEFNIHFLTGLVNSFTIVNTIGC